LEFQNWSDEEFNNFADRMATSAICETHSRFIENIVSRSRAFVPLFKAACAEHLDPEFASWSDEEFYQIINQVKPGANRCESDELTYSLHIIIRYEIERDLINGKIEPKDVPSIWHDKYVEYLGVDEPTDKEGCMQDIHWTDASIGYFPSYALGNLYGAQILNTMKKDLDFEGLIAANKVDVIKKWFADHDYCHDWMDPKDWIKAVTGEALNPQYYLDYLESKF
jgi:carboxypeptidase Taq